MRSGRGKKKIERGLMRPMPKQGGKGVIMPKNPQKQQGEKIGKNEMKKNKKSEKRECGKRRTKGKFLGKSTGDA